MVNLGEAADIISDQRQTIVGPIASPDVSPAPDSAPPSRPRVAIAHDYLTQRGGAERVVLSLTRAFPDAEVYTSFYAAEDTYPEFRDVDIRTAPINNVGPLRDHHRVALPFLPATFSRVKIDADVVVCSSSGWAHGIETSGRKLVFCHAPARWLYQRKSYTAQSSRLTRIAMAGLYRPLKRWDQKKARTADLYLSNSSRTRTMVQNAYGFDTEVLHPPHSIGMGPQLPIDGIEPGFFVYVARLLPYKNVELALAAFAELPNERLVVVGRGPDEARLRALASSNVTFVPELNDDQLRWTYDNAEALVAFATEDFGLSPVEAAVFGTPAIVRGFGGYLDTVTDGVNGVHLDNMTASGVADAIGRLRSIDIDKSTVIEHADRFSEAVFNRRLQAYVETLANA